VEYVTSSHKLSNLSLSLTFVLSLDGT
jgi:hypothetical protein